MTNETIGTVVLGFGPQPMDWIAKAAKVCGKDAVVDPDVARMAGANLAAGNPSALALLRARLEAGALDAVRKKYPQTKLMHGSAEWIAYGERGTSSEALFSHLTSIHIVHPRDRAAHPRDPDDLRRCMLMMDAVPQVIHSSAIVSELSPEWARLMARWAELRIAFETECPNWRTGPWKAPKTYALMKEILNPKAPAQP